MNGKIWIARGDWIEEPLLGTPAYNDTDMRTHSTFGEDRKLRFM